MSKKAVLFLCNGNTAWSQRADALLRHHFEDHFEVESAGLEPGTLNPFTVRVLEERGISTAGMHAKAVIPLLETHSSHFLVTVCDRAEKNCPVGVFYRLAWSFDDPAAFEGSDDGKLAYFRAIRDQIEARILEWAPDVVPLDLPPPPDPLFA